MAAGGGDYWYLTGKGDVGRHAWKNDGIDQKYKKQGNCFRTKEGAEITKVFDDYKTSQEIVF